MAPRCACHIASTETAGVDAAPQAPSMLKNEIPARMRTPPSSIASFAIDDASVREITSHLLGCEASTFAGGDIISQSVEDVAGGRLQFMLPLRSTTKRMVIS